MDLSLQALALLASALTRLRIRFYVGGALASATHGQPRLTEDIDVVMELSPEQVAPLKLELGPDFEVDELGLIEAAKTFRADNIFYLPDFTRFDIHVPTPSEFLDSQFARRVFIELPDSQLPDSDRVGIPLASPEDTLLSKLIWFRKGNEASTKQWEDVIGILRVRGADLEESYLDAWATRLGVPDLLERARAEAVRDEGR